MTAMLDLKNMNVLNAATFANRRGTTAMRMSSDCSPDDVSPRMTQVSAVSVPGSPGSKKVVF